MPGVRTKGQVMIGCWCDEPFVKRIDAARGEKSRSQFARDALLEKLQKMGISVEGLVTTAPDRKGKGGPRRSTSKETHLHPVANNAFNLLPNPETPEHVMKIADEIEAEIVGELKSKRKQKRKHAK